MTEEKIICELCGMTFNCDKSLQTHKYNKHRFYNKSVEEVITKNKPLKSWLLKDIDLGIVEKFYKLHKEYNNFKLSLDRPFLHFYGLVTSVRDINSNDFNIFFTDFLSWKQKNLTNTNSKELCNIVFKDKNEADIAYSKMKSKNPFTGHTGTYSPYSKNFCGYKNLSKEDIEVKRREAAKHNEKGRNTNQVEYWIKKGFSEEEAKMKVSERQRTFTLEKCIEKYGEEEGIKRWQERQEKWLKNYKKQNYSEISQTLFWSIYEKISNQNLDIRFATLGENKQIDNSGKNNEYMLKTNTSYIKPDFVVLDYKKIIEFDGDYWHGKGRGNRMRESERDEIIRDLGYEILHVTEKDFNINPSKIINKCIKFLQS